jgi:hypothetical protein
LKEYPQTYIAFASREAKDNREKILEWAKQTENPVLKRLAQEILEVVGNVDSPGKTQNSAENAEKGRS